MGWATGDLVWVKVQGYPNWPGQVMDPADALKKIQKRGKPGEVLVSFFGDRSYGWFKPKLLFALAEHYDERARKGSTKVWHSTMQRAACASCATQRGTCPFHARACATHAACSHAAAAHPAPRLCTCAIARVCTLVLCGCRCSRRRWRRRQSSPTGAPAASPPRSTTPWTFASRSLSTMLTQRRP